MKIETVLAPVDLSERSRIGIEHAVAAAERFDSKLLLLHVIPMPPIGYAANPWEAYPQMAAAPGQEDRDRIGDKIRAIAEPIVGGRPFETVVSTGDPASVIEETAKERNAGLVVIPTHGYGPFRRFLLGSVANKVLHDLACPVLTGAHIPEIESPGAGSYRRIACAISLDEHSEAVLRWAWDLAQPSGEKLIVIHAAPQMEGGLPYGEWYPQNVREEIAATARRHVDELVAKVGCDAAIHCESGDPVVYVRDVSERERADVLVVGRRLIGHKKRTDAFGIIRESPCPVISV